MILILLFFIPKMGRYVNERLKLDTANKDRSQYMSIYP